jgi:hypothetical protein
MGAPVNPAAGIPPQLRESRANNDNPAQTNGNPGRTAFGLFAAAPMPPRQDPTRTPVDSEMVRDNYTVNGNAA